MGYFAVSALCLIFSITSTCAALLYNQPTKTVIRMNQDVLPSYRTQADISNNGKNSDHSHSELSSLRTIFSGNDIELMVRTAKKRLGLRESPSNLLHMSRQEFECDTCKVLVFTIQNLFASNRSEMEIVEIMINVCVNLDIEDKAVCEGAVKEYKVEVLTVVDRLALSPSELCGAAFGTLCASEYNPFKPWNVTLPHVPKPPLKPYKLPKPGSPTLRILHLSDIHMDENYVPYSNAECDEPVCCRKASGPPNGTAGAGFWGDYRKCDLPLWTLKDMFKHLMLNEKFDMIYWTGDLPGHEVWLQTREEILRMLDSLSHMFKKYFPNVPVYSTLGNHEGVPVDAFPPPFIKGNDSVKWLYNALVRDWKLPVSTHYDLARGGFYTLLIKPGLRLVSINTNYCNTRNWWLLLNMTDPVQELAWLAKTLQAAEDNQEKVHIIGHIPPGTSCSQWWSWNYYNIIARYEGTITGQFFGHTHRDSFEIFYDPASDLKRPVSVAYISPSVTTYSGSNSGLNPGYRVFVADGNYTGSSWQILDHETFILNLTEANISNKTRWFRTYSAKEAYAMHSLFPQDWDALVHQMNKSDTTLQKYYRLNNKLHPPAPRCDADCKANLLCELLTGRTYDPHLCRDVPHMKPDLAQFYKSHQRWLLETNKC